VPIRDDLGTPSDQAWRNDAKSCPVSNVLPLAQWALRFLDWSSLECGVSVMVRFKEAWREHR
jgi:hypothetical protein